jgi:hypothetical protein
MGAFLAKRVSTDHARARGIEKVMALAVSRFEQLSTRVVGQPDETRIVSEARNTLESKLTKWKAILQSVRTSLDHSLSYYGDMVIDVSRDYAEHELTPQLDVVRIEFEAKDNEYLIPYANLFFSHLRRFQERAKADKPAWLKEIVNVEKRETNDDQQQ